VSEKTEHLLDLRDEVWIAAAEARDARHQFGEAMRRLEAAVVAALAARVITEVTCARVAGVSRTTIRKWAGK
jgi:ABC-type tungstate transport system substrate-binding protein